ICMIIFSTSVLISSAAHRALLSFPTRRSSDLGGYVVFTATDGSATVRVPYAGFKGDFQAIQVLKPTANGFPWLATEACASHGKRSEEHTSELQSRGHLVCRLLLEKKK